MGFFAVFHHNNIQHLTFLNYNGVIYVRNFLIYKHPSHEYLSKIIEKNEVMWI